jgi:NADH-quinone oxidoreductase subunit A
MLFMTELVGYLVLFTGLGVFFLFIHLMIGKLIRPNKPDPDKLTIYECGEPTIGSAWIQFDLRFYVVALLFVIFDVEVAFFFPWAVVFGQANTLAITDAPKTEEQRQEYNAQIKKLVPDYAENQPALAPYKRSTPELTEKEIRDNQRAAHQLAWFAFWDILIFFGVLLVGFAYLWKRGDLNWVRSTAAEKAQAPPPLVAAKSGAEALAGAGSGSLM